MEKKKHARTAFFAAIAVFYMASGFAHPVTPTLIKRLSLEDFMFGLALAMMMTSNFLFSPFWGKLSGILSSRVTLCIGCTGYAAGQVLFALAQTRFQFLFARFFAGIFVGAAFVGILIGVVEGAPSERARGRDLLTSATLQAVFGSMGYFVGGMLGEIHVYVSVVAQAATLLACGLAFLLIPGPGRGAAERPPARDMLREANPFRAFLQGRQFLSAAFALLFSVCALQSLSQTAFDQSFNYYVIDRIGLSTGYNGLIKAAMGIVTLLANSTLCAYLMRRGDVRRSVVYVLLGATACIAGVLCTRALAPFLAGSILFYALSAISIPMTQSLVASAETAADRSLVMGFYNSLKSLGGIVGALLAGFTYTLSPQAPFVCCAAALLAATGLSAAYARK